MLTVSQVLKEGMGAYQSGRKRSIGDFYIHLDGSNNIINDTHHIENVPVRNRYSGRTNLVIRRIRHDIDFNDIWQIGWDLAEYLEQRNATR